MTKKPQTYPLRYVEFFSASATKLQSNYRNAQQEIIFHHPARARNSCATLQDLSSRMSITREALSARPRKTPRNRAQTEPERSTLVPAVGRLPYPDRDTL